jgi:hypothetical protein
MCLEDPTDTKSYHHRMVERDSGSCGWPGVLFQQLRSSRETLKDLWSFEKLTETQIDRSWDFLVVFASKRGNPLKGNLKDRRSSDPITLLTRRYVYAMNETGRWITGRANITRELLLFICVIDRLYLPVIQVQLHPIACHKALVAAISCLMEGSRSFEEANSTWLIMYPDDDVHAYKSEHVLLGGSIQLLHWQLWMQPTSAIEVIEHNLGQENIPKQKIKRKIINETKMYG